VFKKIPAYGLQQENMESQIWYPLSVLCDYFFIKSEGKQSQRNINPVGFSKIFYDALMFSPIRTDLVMPGYHQGNFFQQILST